MAASGRYAQSAQGVNEEVEQMYRVAEDMIRTAAIEASIQDAIEEDRAKQKRALEPPIAGPSGRSPAPGGKCSTCGALHAQRRNMPMHAFASQPHRCCTPLFDGTGQPIRTQAILPSYGHGQGAAARTSPIHEPFTIAQQGDSGLRRPEAFEWSWEWEEPGLDGTEEVHADGPVGADDSLPVLSAWGQRMAAQRCQWAEARPMMAAAVLKAQAIPDPAPPCSNCMTPQACVHCQDCRAHLCSDCDAALHQGHVHQHRRRVWFSGCYEPLPVNARVVVANNVPSVERSRAFMPPSVFGGACVCQACSQRIACRMY